MWEIVFQALGKGLLDATDEELIFTEAHGGDVGELIVFVDERSVGIGSETTAGEDVRRVTEWRAVSQLVIAREREKAASSRCGERMRIFRWLLLLLDSIYRCPAGRATARGTVTS